MGRRNVQGGNKAKGMARNRHNHGNNNQLITPEGDEQKYAIVISIFGGGRFSIETEDGERHIAILPGSMKGSKRRNNNVELNSILMINNRSSWQSIKPNSQADIEHVYSSKDIDYLKLNEKFQKILNERCFQTKTMETDIIFESTNNTNIVAEENIVQYDKNDFSGDIDLSLI